MNIVIPGLFPRIDVLTVTPAIAREWLARNSHNRSIRERKVEEYARDMQSGEWRVNGETIKFSADGTLLDGQHRLRAVIAADLPVQLIVVTGLDSGTQATMDAGAKRTAADAFSLDGEKHAQTLAAVIRRAWAWERGDYKLSMNAVPTTAESARFLTDHPEIRRSAEIAVQVRHQYRYVLPTSVGVAHFLFSRISAADAAFFFVRLGDGAELPLGHPILTLRKRLLSDAASQKKTPDHFQLALLIRAWNAMRVGRAPTHFKRITQDDAMPMPGLTSSPACGDLRAADRDSAGPVY